MIEIDYAAAMRAMREAVNEFGENYVYENSGEPGQCVYVLNGAPSCLVGHALHKLGVSLEFLREMDDGSEELAGSVPASSVALVLGGRHIANITEKARMAFMEAQGMQDEGNEWGYSLDRTRELLSGFHEDGTHDYN